MESSGRLIVLLVAGVIVAFAAIAIRNHYSEQPSEPAPVVEASKRVIVAKHDITLGTLVQLGSDIDWGEPPAEWAAREDLLREGVVRLEDFSGAVARRMLKTGEPLTASALTKAGEGGFMSAVLEPGMRAVSIAVNATSGNAGFISPGDRVDLIVTHHVKQGANAGDAIVSETFVYNIRVLAVDQMLDNPDNKAILAKTLTVEVDPHQAEQIAVASELGRLSVTLRSLAADTKPAAVAPVAAADGAAAAPAITELYGTDNSIRMERKSLSPRMRVIRGDQIDSVEF